MRIRLLLTLALMAAIIYGQQHKPDFAKELRYPGIPTFQEYHPLPIEQSLERKARLFRGEDDMEGSFPFFGQVYMGKIFIGGCAAIGKKKIVTAGHVIRGLLESDVSILMSNRTDPDLSLTLTPVSFTIHPGFLDAHRRKDYFPLYDWEESYDLALIDVKEDISDFIYIESKAVTVAQMAIVLGMGEYDSFDVRLPAILQWKKIDLHPTYRQTNFYFSEPLTGKYDSGSPLVIRDKNQNFVLVGVVSGIQIFEGGIYSRYIKMAEFVPWFEENGVLVKSW